MTILRFKPNYHFETQDLNALKKSYIAIGWICVKDDDCEVIYESPELGFIAIYEKKQGLK